MTTRLEVYVPQEKRFILVGSELPPGRTGSLSSTDDEGNREIIIFSCEPDNSSTTIFRSKKGIDIQMGTQRNVYPDPEQFETVQLLKPGQSYEMNIKPDNSAVMHKLRFTHTK